MKGFGIWYDDGGCDCGWMNHEGRHGRPYLAEYDSRESAESDAEVERQRDPSVIFYVAPLDSDLEKLSMTVHKLANARRLERAKAELRRAERAVKCGDAEPRPKTAFERVLNDED